MFIVYSVTLHALDLDGMSVDLYILYQVPVWLFTELSAVFSVVLVAVER